ncbi:hypothetical protein F511_13185 [Dorcoceras hygrometricum]|uniref:Uncharacterized protein n=1 Tax=Dorcoceras hygrometricum TaxID=472368 RepID=A0A2Z7B1L1_9LAMI|nr:hypothetical protein F511_13185 [Dorcoceras hygrometricum]
MSCELKSENERLNEVMSSWTKSSVSLSKLHETQKPLNDKSGLGFCVGESSSEGTSTQSDLAYDKFKNINFVKASVIHNAYESVKYDDQTSGQLNQKGKAVADVGQTTAQVDTQEDPAVHQLVSRSDPDAQAVNASYQLVSNPILEQQSPYQLVTYNPDQANQSNIQNEKGANPIGSDLRWNRNHPPEHIIVDWAVKMRISPPEIETSICDAKYRVSFSTRSVLGKWVYLVTLAMSLFDLQDVCIAIGSLATLDLPMVVDLIGIYVLKGPYCTLTMTNWFLQALSVIPRGSWRDVARRLAAPPPKCRRPAAAYVDRTCSDQLDEEFSSVLNSSVLLVQADEGVLNPVVDLIDDLPPPTV